MRTLVAGLLMLIVGSGPLTAGASPADPIERVRSTNPRIRAAIAEGYATSNTFRRLVDGLQKSDVILHIEAGDCGCDRARACLGFVSYAGGTRYLRSRVNLRQIQRALIQEIGHELHHASEVAAAAQVTSPEHFAQLFEALRSSGCGGAQCYETRGALESEAAVRTELSLSRGRPVHIACGDSLNDACPI